jgi:hypothetical protein
LRIDRRIQKTLNLLHDALGSLIREKPYDEIVVQEILDHANVGRSTLRLPCGNNKTGCRPDLPAVADRPN